ncbi:DASS family sodium-coupled anion symporter [Aliarcobacter butzleri]|uniref:DASS family sodium-coupled anion symporter n=1 Tax=Aliarcobacter butzleri TaxID=28197 RepID=UPI002B24DF13|nr:DASS family sodium-coupled anion symporter [Aliarcobacter butzleri]
MSKQTLKLFVPIIVAIALWFVPAPEGLTQNAWHFLAIFFAVVVGLILEPVPAALVGFAGVSFVAVLGLIGNSKESITWALSGFSNSVIWLIFAAFMFALGYKKTGLGKRVSLIMVKYMGKSSLGLGYAVAFSDLILAPFMPSNTARSGGSVYPVAINIPHIFDSWPDKEPRKLGAYITWGEWASVMLPLMIPLFLLTPWLTYVIYPPTQKTSPEAPAWAAEELKKLGAITFKEYLMAGLATVALVLWIFGKEFGIDATTTAICIVSVMVLTGVITWDDLLSDKAAFNVFIWFSTLVAMADGLKKVGILDYIGKNAQTALSDLHTTSLLIALIVLFFLLHYFFASVTAHVTALVPVFMVIAASLLPAEQILPFTIILAGSLGVMGIITPYGTGPSPIWYGAGYISQAKWWGLGAIFGTLYLAVIILGAFLFI